MVSGRSLKFSLTHDCVNCLNKTVILAMPLVALAKPASLSLSLVCESLNLYIVHYALYVQRIIPINIVSEIECVQLSEPGRVTVICQIRVTLNSDVQPLCHLDNFGIDVRIPCKYIIMS